MRIALINTSKKNSIYPLGLLKIGQWQKSKGNECKLFNLELPKKGEFDEIWISTLFTFDIPKQLGIATEALKRSNVVRVGGIASSLIPNPFKKLGCVVHVGLLKGAEKFNPDYSLLSEIPKYSISHTSRGCSRKCGFCMVSKLEPEFHQRENWERDLNDSKQIKFFDNNWLAKGEELVFKDIEKLKKLVLDKKISSIDFNQGLDCRLMTMEIAKELKDIPCDPVRFAFDGMHEDKYFQNAIELMVKYSNKKYFTNYVLYNYKDSPEDFYYRLKEHSRLSEKLNISCLAFPMRFQPILEWDSLREHVGIRWTIKQKKGFMRILDTQAISGIINLKTIKEFQYWFTESAEKFASLISWEKVGEYSDRKAGLKRIKKYGK